MRKLKLLCLCGLTAAVLMTGCAGSTDTTNVNLGSATVSEYRGVKVNVAAPEVTDDEVDQKIQTNLKQNPNEVEVDRAAKDGDIVNIDYKGTKAEKLLMRYCRRYGSDSWLQDHDRSVLKMV